MELPQIVTMCLLAKPMCLDKINIKGHGGMNELDIQLSKIVRNAAGQMTSTLNHSHGNFLPKEFFQNCMYDIYYGGPTNYCTLFVHCWVVWWQ